MEGGREEDGGIEGGRDSGKKFERESLFRNYITSNTRYSR